jgi:uncharacterized protein
MEPVDVRGRFVWHQLMTRDAPRARSFYSKVAGWKTEPWAHNENFTVCSAKVGPVAGIMVMPADAPADAPAMWVSYIGTDDVDGTVEEARKLGARVIKSPTDEQGAGRYAVLQDPQGAVFAVLKPMVAPGDAQPPPEGTFSWHELATTDNEAAFAFYSALFGWEALQRMDMGATGIYLIFGNDGRQRGGIYNKPADGPAPSNWLPYTQVAGADATHASAVKAGATSMMPPMDVPGGSRIAIFSDAEGATFAVVAAGAAPAAKPAKAKAPATPKAKATAKPKAKAKPAARKPAKKPAKKSASKPVKKTSAKKAKPKVAKKAKAKSSPLKKSKNARRKK